MSARVREQYPISAQRKAFNARLVKIGGYGLDASGPNLPHVGANVCVECAGNARGRFLPLPHRFTADNCLAPSGRGRELRRYAA